ncbi:MAG: RHS repeat-associated core domain-containing protein [Candidatus Kapaibacterium sp.]
MQTHNPYGGDRWTNSNLAETESTLLNWVGKEKDNESKLGDHGVRKYEYETGRFISIDPLWSNYYGWTPYQYSMNSPISRIDVNGDADFLLNGGAKVSDGVNDGNIFATSNFAFSASLLKNSKGVFGIDFNKMSLMSSQLPNANSEELANILSFHKSLTQGEAGGAGGGGTFYEGGRNFDPPTTKHSGKATTEVNNAIKESVSKGLEQFLTYFTHDHPGGAYEDTPSQGDRDAINQLNHKYGINLQFGILFWGSAMRNSESVTIFNGYDSADDVVIPRQVLEDYSK